MANIAQDKDFHLLFHGELADAPGRFESWDEYLRYRGHSRWELLTRDVDASGNETNAPTKEFMSTKALVHWVLERDAELEEGRSEIPDNRADRDEDDRESEPGPRESRLREIAIAVGASHCVSCLDRWRHGSWPPLRSARLRLLDITGVTERPVWIRVFHTVFNVETNLGRGYMYPPGPDRTARVVLASESAQSSGRQVQVSKALMAKVASMMPEFDALKRR